MPDWAREVRTRLGAARLSPTREADVVDELTQHLQDRYAELVAGGTAPDEAARLTLNEFENNSMLGDRLAVLRQAQAPRPLTPAAPTGAFASDFWHDVRAALRQLVQQPGYSAVVVTTLAVCLAANVAIFAVVDGVVLRALPFPDAERLVAIYNTYPGPGADIAPNSATDFFDRQALPALAGLATYRRLGLTLGREGSAPERVQSLVASPSLFPLLGTQVARGRVLLDADAEPGAEPKAMLTFGYWQRAFAGQESAIGAPLFIDGRPVTVVGVLPEEWRFIDPSIEVVIPTAFSPKDRLPAGRHRNNNWQQLGRLAPGAAVELLQSQLNALNAALLEQTPELRQALSDIGFSTRAMPFGQFVAGATARSLYLLWAGALVVLLVAGVNLANMAMVRASVRRRDWATRVALGASTWRLLRQSLIEVWVLAVLGVTGGLLLGHVALMLGPALGLDSLPRGTESTVGWRVGALATTLAAVCSTALGVLPVLAHRSGRLESLLRDEGRTRTDARGPRTLRRALVITQVAGAVTLLVIGAALTASLKRVLEVDLGFETERLLTAQVTLPVTSYSTGEASRTFVNRLLERVRSLPDVRAAGIASATPLGSSPGDNVIFAEGYEMAQGESPVSVHHVSVSDGYFETLGARLVSGRWFDQADAEGRRRVIIIDDRLARRFFPDGDAVGRRMWQLRSTQRMLEPPPDDQMLTIIGVVAEVRLTNVVDAPGSRTNGVCYYPFEQRPTLTAGLAVRSAGNPGAAAAGVRAALADVDPQLPLHDVADIDTLIDRSLFDRRTPAILAAGFAVVTLLLAALGVYGVLAYQVAQRTRELGIRMALGADAARLFRLVLREGLVMTGLGAVVGLGLAAALRRAIETQLYGIGMLDPALVSAVVGLLAATTLLAMAIPAVRAANTDPTVAMSQTN